MVVWQAMTKALAGTAIGVIAVLGAVRFLAGMLCTVPTKSDLDPEPTGPPTAPP